MIIHVKGQENVTNDHKKKETKAVRSLQMSLILESWQDVKSN